MRHFIKTALLRAGWEVSIHRYRPHVAKIKHRVTDLELIAHYLDTAAPVVIDGGAHNGGTLAAYVQAFPNATVHSFEPNPLVFKELQANAAKLARDYPAAGIHCWPRGLGGTASTAEFYHYAKRTMSGFNRVNLDSEYVRLIVKAMKAKNPNFKECDFLVNTYNVPIVTVDDFMAERGIDRLHVLKLDIEGHEIDCLRGARKALEQRRIDIIFSELIASEQYLGKAITFTEFESYLLPYGYQLAGVLNPMTAIDRKKTIMMDVCYVRSELAGRPQ